MNFSAPIFINMSVPFGHELRKKYFTRLAPEVIPVNHGSYGLTPAPIHDKFIAALNHDHEFPDRYARFELKSEYIELLKALGTFLNTDYRNLAIVDNATTGVNTVLRSYPFKQGDKIVVASTGYDSCVRTLEFLRARVGVEIITVDINYPVEDDEIIEKYRAVFEKSRPQLALFDTVTSIPGVRFPFEKLVALCREFDVISLIDGAHSIGLIEIDLAKLKPDVYTSNLHKWLYVPRGCAVLYADPRIQGKIHTMPISFSYLDEDAELQLDPEDIKNRFIDKFSFVGSKTYAQISCIVPAIEFRKFIGGEKAIANYCHELCLKVGQEITENVWPGTHILENESKSLTTAMINIEVPIDKFAKDVGSKGLDVTDISEVKKCVDAIQYHLAYKDNTYVQLFVHHGKFCCRFSCQIYNELEDYVNASKFLESAFHHYFSLKLRL